MTTAKMRFCCYCGAEIGVLESRFYDRSDTCGAQECERYMRDCVAEEREEAHRELDRNNDWD